MRVRVRLGTVRPELEEQSEGEVGFGRKRKPAECNRIARRPPEAGPHPLCECRFGPTLTVSDRGGLKTGGQGGRESRGPGLSEEVQNAEYGGLKFSTAEHHLTKKDWLLFSPHSCCRRSGEGLHECSGGRPTTNHRAVALGGGKQWPAVVWKWHPNERMAPRVSSLASTGAEPWHWHFALAAAEPKSITQTTPGRAAGQAGQRGTRGQGGQA